MASWVTRQASPVSVEPIGEFRAIYLEANGMTHLVDPVSAEVLLFLSSGPHSESALLAHVITVVGDPEITWVDIESVLLRPLVQEGMIEALV